MRSMILILVWKTATYSTLKKLKKIDGDADDIDIALMKFVDLAFSLAFSLLPDLAFSLALSPTHSCFLSCLLSSTLGFSSSGVKRQCKMNDGLSDEGCYVLFQRTSMFFCLPFSPDKERLSDLRFTLKKRTYHMEAAKKRCFRPTKSLGSRIWIRSITGFKETCPNT